MYHQKQTKTKIIATIGPACQEKEVLRKLIHEGVDVCRLNFSHGKHEEHKKVIDTIKELNAEMGTSVAILADLQGPKLRIGEVENNGVMLVDGALLSLVTTDVMGTATKVSITYKPLPLDVMPGEFILVDDGKIKLEVVETNRKDEVVTRVISGGILSSKKGVNLPNTKISLPSLTEKDLENANFVLDFDIDWIALSFVRSASDIVTLKKLIGIKNKVTRVIAKIEKPEAIADIDGIIEMADGIMVARGDLGVEIPFDKVPVLQKTIINKCIIAAKPVIVATQMMESMITNFRPTRAEATDVANAVMDGADALMLSGETSVGKYPAEVIRSMHQIISATEGSMFELVHPNIPNPSSENFLPDTICYNACKMADLANAKGIVVFTSLGGSAYKIASNRPKATIFAFTPNKEIISQLNIAKGIKTHFLETKISVNDAIQEATDILKNSEHIQKGDVLVFVGGIPMREYGRINMMKISTVE
ncbi:MAG: pyruvate kinase [Breznakibacter sp.]|nr:pyruvate kinase [Breznakibacter sp.]